MIKYPFKINLEILKVSKLGLVLGLEGNQKIAPDENWSPVRVSFGNSGGNLPRGQLF